MKRAYVKTEYIKSLSPQAFAALTGILLSSYDESLADDWVTTRPFTIASVLTGKEPTRRDLKIVAKGFKELVDLGILTVYRLGDYVINYSKIERTNEPFVCLDKKEVREIINSDEDVRRTSLLQYFAYLKSTFNYKNGIGNESLSFYCKGFEKNLVTIIKYHSVLEKLGILKVFRFKPIRRDGVTQKPKNIYCCPEDEKSALKYALSKGYSLRLKEDAAEDEGLESDDSEK